MNRVYNVARGLFVGALDAAREHARWIVGLEQSVGVAIERPVQDGLDSPAATRLLSGPRHAPAAPARAVRRRCVPAT